MQTKGCEGDKAYWYFADVVLCSHQDYRTGPFEVVFASCDEDEGELENVNWVSVFSSKTHTLGKMANVQVSTTCSYQSGTFM